MVGPAMTVRYVPTGLGRGTVGDYLDNCEPGQVIVLDNNGRTDCTVWGEILTVLAHEKGIAGTAINGACRDIDRAIALDYPIYTRGHFMRTGKDRVEVADVQVPVVLGNVQVRPGDIIVGDSDGIVVVPDAISDQVASLAREIADIEERIVDAARMGLSLGEARERYGYHALQRPVRPS
jgi:regulator of RNase E activity RraA